MLKLYFCRLRSDPNTYMGRLLTSRGGYTRTQDPCEIGFSTSMEDMLETAKKYPELEVCRIQDTPVPVSQAAPLKPMNLQ